MCYKQGIAKCNVSLALLDLLGQAHQNQFYCGEAQKRMYQSIRTLAVFIASKF